MTDTKPKWEEEFDKMTPDGIPSKSGDLYGEGSISEWLKEHSTEHLYEDYVYGEPMCDLSEDKIKSFISSRFVEKETVRELVQWLLGYEDFPMKKDGDGMYYWRKELRERFSDLLSRLQKPQGTFK